MRKAVLAVMTAGSIFALTAAGASAVGISIGEQSTTAINQAAHATTTVTEYQCQATWNITYALTGNAITTVTATDASGTNTADCGNAASADATWTFGSGDPVTGEYSGTTHAWTFTTNTTPTMGEGLESTLTVTAK